MRDGFVQVQVLCNFLEGWLVERRALESGWIVVSVMTRDLLVFCLGAEPATVHSVDVGLEVHAEWKREYLTV